MTTQERPSVLIVEDDRATREMYEYALRMAGLTVVVANDGFAALRMIDQEVPDVIVLDLDLPHVTGMDVHEEVMAHAETRITPVVVVTGTEWPMPASVFRILRKPINSETLVNAVLQALSSKDESPSGTDRRAR
jgi:DNA-binding response OmpR family regulator